jgi:hypothetical protein
MCGIAHGQPLDSDLCDVDSGSRATGPLPRIHYLFGRQDFFVWDLHRPTEIHLRPHVTTAYPPDLI